MFNRLRSLAFRMERDHLFSSSQYQSPLQIILNVSTNLSHLNVTWKDFSRCSGRYPRITHVHLVLECGNHRTFDTDHLNILIPQVNYLLIGGHQLVRETSLINLVSKLLADNNYFRQIILLQINKDGNVRLKPRRKANIIESIMSRINRLRNTTTNRLEFNYHNILTIWLRWENRFLLPYIRIWEVNARFVCVFLSFCDDAYLFFCVFGYSSHV